MSIDKQAVDRIEELEAELAETHADLAAQESIIEDLELQVAALTKMSSEAMGLLRCNLLGS